MRWKTILHAVSNQIASAFTREPPAVLSTGSVSIVFDGNTYTGSYVVRDDAMVEVHCSYGHREAKVADPSQAMSQEAVVYRLIREIIQEAARAGRLPE